MRIGMVGLGRMGGAMAKRLLRTGIEVVGFDLDPELGGQLASTPGGRAATTLEALLDALPPPRSCWVMLPAGAPTGEVIDFLGRHAAADDIILDGGNSRYTDTLGRATRLAERGVNLLDVGTSGGVRGAEEGYCLMVGGPQEAFLRCEPVFRALAVEGGFAHVGAVGAGHFTKMIHNGIEYGLLQAYAEGLEMLHAAPFELDLAQIARLWNQGSIIRGWLLELIEAVLRREGDDLDGIRGWVADSGEGRWTIESALELEVPVPVIALSLLARFRSRQDDSYAARVIAALRQEFGGHSLRQE